MSMGEFRSKSYQGGDRRDNGRSSGNRDSRGSSGRSFGGDRRSGGRSFGGDRRSGGRSFGGNNNRGNFGRGPLQKFDVVCAKCGKDTQVPFKPTGDKPVYCRECFGGEDKRGKGNSNQGVSKEEFEKLNKKLDKILEILSDSDKKEDKKENSKKKDKKVEVKEKVKEDSKPEEKVDVKEEKEDVKDKE